MKATLLLITFLCAASATAQTNTAAFRAYARSLSINPTTVVNRVGNQSFQLFFTTSDPTWHMPLYVPTTEGSVIVSSELRQVPGSSTFTADYGFWSAGFMAQDGRISLSFPIRDRDMNLIPDFIDAQRTFYAGITGRGVNQFPTTNKLTLEGRFARAAGQTTGAYTGAMRGTGANYNFNGVLGQLALEGTVEYIRGYTNELLVSAVRFDQLGNPSLVTGSIPYLATSKTLHLMRSRLTNELGHVYQVKPTTLTRIKKRYVGPLLFVDGAVETPWADYLKWVVEISDLNDANLNNIPDITDPLMVPDTRGPAVTIVSPEGVLRTRTLPARVKGIANDKSGVAQVSFRVDLADGGEYSWVATGTESWTIELNYLLQGTNTVWVQAQDGLGNWSSPVKRKIVYREP